MGWMDEYDIDILNSERQYEEFVSMKGVPPVFKLKHKTIRFIIRSSPDGFSFSMESMRLYLENLEKRLFLNMIGGEYYVGDNLPVVAEGMTSPTLDIKKDGYQVLFDSENDKDIEDCIIENDHKSIVCLLRTGWDMSIREDFDEGITKIYFRRRMCFGVLPERFLMLNQTIEKELANG